MFSSVTLCSLRSPFVFWSSFISSQRVRPCAMLSTWYTWPVLSFHNKTHVAISYVSVLGPHQKVSTLLKSEEKINITLPLLYSVFSNGIIKCSFRFVLFCFSTEERAWPATLRGGHYCYMIYPREETKVWEGNCPRSARWKVWEKGLEARPGDAWSACLATKQKGLQVNSFTCRRCVWLELGRFPLGDLEIWCSLQIF